MSLSTISASTAVYQKLIKPVFFQLTTPDDAHHIVLKAGKLIQRSNTALWLCKLFTGYRNEELLSQRLEGIFYANPIGLAAGFDKNLEITPFLQSLGLGFIEGGSVTRLPYEGNPRPWFHRLPKAKSILVHAGMPNQGLTNILPRIINTPLSVPLTLSIGVSNSFDIKTLDDAVADIAASLRLAAVVPAIKSIDINISCPNLLNGLDLSQPESLDRLLTELDTIDHSQPLFLKMPLSDTWEEFEELVDVALSHKIDRLIIANLEHNHDNIAAITKGEAAEGKPGSLSGIPTRERCNEFIARTYVKCGDRVAITGVGGVYSAEDAYEKIRLGASLVQIITGLIYTGPQIAGLIASGLVELLKADGFSSIEDAIGIDAEKAVAALEAHRVSISS